MVQLKRLQIFRAPLLASMAMVLLAGPGCQCQRQKGGTNWVEVVSQMTTTDGRAIPMNDLKENFVVLNFWATWCGPCIQETPSLLRLAAENPSRIRLISVSEDDSLKELKQFLHLYPNAQAANVFVTHDLNKRMSEIFAVRQFPETIIFDQNLKPLKRVQGAVDWTSQEIREFFHLTAGGS